MPRAVALLLPLALAAPAGAQQFRISRPEVDFAADVDFARLQRFAWKTSQDPGDDPSAHASFVYAIERELEARGLSRAETAEAADVLVRYYTRHESRVRRTTSQERAVQPDNLRTSVDLERVADGTLVIELYTAADERRVWRGRTTEVAAKKRFEEEALQRAVRLILAEYPPRPEPPGPGR